jgi:hypothetical protein
MPYSWIAIEVRLRGAGSDVAFRTVIGALADQSPLSLVCDFTGSQCDQESQPMKFARRLTQKRWVQKTIGVAAADAIRFF